MNSTFEVLARLPASQYDTCSLLQYWQIALLNTYLKTRCHQLPFEFFEQVPHMDDVFSLEIEEDSTALKENTRVSKQCWPPIAKLHGNSSAVIACKARPLCSGIFADQRNPTAPKRSAENLIIGNGHLDLDALPPPPNDAQRNQPAKQPRLSIDRPSDHPQSACTLQPSISGVT